jgi:hypothetical protein
MGKLFCRTVLILLLAGLVVPAAAPAHAQQRDQALSEVIELNRQLIARTQSGAASGRDIWVGTQALTEALRRLILAETEARADEKVAPPAITALRPGETLAQANGTPGEEAPLSAVPTPWFNLQAQSAQESLDALRQAVEGEAPRETLILRLSSVLNALERMRHPPSVPQG